MTRHLEQTEARETPDLDTRAVGLGGLAQTLFDGALITRLFHVDEVDDDQTADIADTQLATDFIGRFEVGVGRGRFDVTTARRAGGVDVDRHQRFGVVDDQRAARGQLHLVRIGRFDLTFDLIAREERDVVGVVLETAPTLCWHEALHVFGGERMGARLVDQYFADILGEVITQRTSHRITFPIHEEGCRARKHRVDDFVPLDLEVIEIPLQFFDGSADPCSTHDRPHPWRDHEGIHDVAHGIAVFALDATADAARTRVVRHQDEEATGEGDIGGERCPFVAALFFLDLNDDVLPFLQHLAHVDASATGLLEEVFAGDFLQRQEAVTFGTVIDEAGFERGLDSCNARLVDVRLLLLPRGQLDRQIEKFLTVNQCDAQFFLLRRVYQHSFHGPQNSVRMGPTASR